MKRFSAIRRWSVRLLLLLFVLPVGLHALVWSARGWPDSWRDADWSSAGLLPPAGELREATIRIYSARTGGWKGIFATHSWIVLKREGESEFTRYDVVGWGSPVRRNHRPPDGRWYGNPPEIVAAIDGPSAGPLIPEVEAAIARYPWNRKGDYRVWPGPNSNTFVAAVLAEVPQLGATLPATAIGRDYPVDGHWLGWTSRGGLRLSIGGYAGLVAGWHDGLEINLFGLVAGIDPAAPALTLPGFGRFPRWAPSHDVSAGGPAAVTAAQGSGAVLIGHPVRVARCPPNPRFPCRHCRSAAREP